MNFLAAYIMRGRVQAMAVASSLALLSLLFPPVSIVSSASVALVTLRRGATEGLYVLGCSSLVAGLLGWGLFGDFQFALLYVLALWLPVWLIGIILREGRQLSVAVEIAVLLGALAVAGCYVFNPDISATWLTVFGRMMDPANLPPDAPIADFKHTAAIISHYMTGIVATGSVFSLLFGLFLGRWWQANLYNPGGFKTEYLALRMPTRFAAASLLVIAAAQASSGVLSEAAWNISVLLLVLYGIVGTAVLHALFAGMKLARFTVPMLYITLFLIPHAILLAAVVGLADAWLNLRKHQSKHTTPKA
ncbi:DUF2232 domain-containing protein [Methylovulum psychrotolerans]|uniref:DUF2232 domain-containing protein n=2 Tax=Methylovulum psychrotolerans TaxID=1704499 RepID=A0A2S5CN28_9GAMM|nr:DUF2232 domain-containing protein [Methylovulum psychrotolerans]POZ52157.1 hypothetical protein AADEFJLK_01627 [Methylovulum psychrotolerans]